MWPIHQTPGDPNAPDDDDLTHWHFNSQSYVHTKHATNYTYTEVYNIYDIYADITIKSETRLVCATVSRNFTQL